MGVKYSRSVCISESVTSEYSQKHTVQLLLKVIYTIKLKYTWMLKGNLIIFIALKKCMQDLPHSPELMDLISALYLPYRISCLTKGLLKQF